MELPRLADRSGVLTSLLCMLLLVSYHASRDALITVLPSISACTNVTPSLIRPLSSVRHPLVAATTRLTTWNSRGPLERRVSRFLRHFPEDGGDEDGGWKNERLETEDGGYEDGGWKNVRLETEDGGYEDGGWKKERSETEDGGYEDSNWKNVKQEREVEGSEDNLAEKAIEKDEASASGTGGYVKRVSQDSGKIERGPLETKKGDNAHTQNSSLDYDDEVITDIRKSLLEKGYNVGPSLVRELLSFQNQLDTLRSSRNDAKDSTDYTTFFINALSTPKTIDASSSDAASSTESSDVNGSEGNNVEVDKALKDDSKSNSTRSNRAEMKDNAGTDSSAGTAVAAISYSQNEATVTAPKVSQANFVTEKQLLKLTRLLDYIGEVEENMIYPMTGGEAGAEEEDEARCESYDFKGLMFLSNWQLAVQGSVLAGLHLTSIIGLFVGHYCIEISTAQASTVGAVFTLQVALLLLVTEAVTSLGAVALVAIRAWQGLVQGACYPVVYSLLESKNIHSRVMLGVIFSGPWLGSMLGTSLGTQPYWAATYYASGAAVLVVCVAFVFLDTAGAKPQAVCKWGEVLRRDVLVCALMHLGAVWVLHTVLLACTLVVSPPDRWWVLLLVLLAGGVVAQMVDVFIEPVIPQPNKPARSHLLIATVVSFAFTIASLLVLALEGDEEEVNLALFVRVGGVMGAAFGYGVASIGYREVLEAVEGRRRSKALVITNVAGALGASLACWLMFPMVQAGGSGGYIAGCVLPFSAASGGAVCVFMLLLFPKTPDLPGSEGRPSAAEGAEDAAVIEGAERGALPEVYVIRTPVSSPSGQARAPPDGMSQRSVDNRSYRSYKSFKSAISTATFKTAASRPRATSIATVYEDVEDDLDDVSLECKSIALESSDGLQPREDGLRRLEVQSLYSDLLSQEDKTSAWVHTHHRHLDLHRTSSAGTHEPFVPPKPLPGLLF